MFARVANVSSQFSQLGSQVRIQNVNYDASRHIALIEPIGTAGPSVNVVQTNILETRPTIIQENVGLLETKIVNSVQPFPSSYNATSTNWQQDQIIASQVNQDLYNLKLNQSVPINEPKHENIKIEVTIPEERKFSHNNLRFSGMKVNENYQNFNATNIIQPERRLYSNNQIINPPVITTVNRVNTVTENSGASSFANKINPFASVNSQQINTNFIQENTNNINSGNTHIDVKVTENDDSLSISDSDLSDSDIEDIGDQMNRVDLRSKDSYFVNKPNFNIQPTINTNFNAQSTMNINNFTPQPTFTNENNFNANPNSYTFNNPNAYYGSSKSINNNLNNENYKIEVKIDENNQGMNNFNGYSEARSRPGSNVRLNTAYTGGVSNNNLNNFNNQNQIINNRPNTAFLNSTGNELRGSRNNLNFNQTVRRQSSLSSLNNSTINRNQGVYDQKLSNANLHNLNNFNQTSNSDIRRAVTMGSNNRIMTNPTVTTLRAGSNLNNY